MRVSSALATGATILSVALVLSLGSILAGRVFFRWWHGYRARLVAPVRPYLLQLASGEDTAGEALDYLVDLPPRVWRAVEPHAISLLGKVRGEGQTDLILLFKRRGVPFEALRRLQYRGVIRRARAAELLGLLGHAAAVPELSARLADRSPEVRQVAARALGRIGDSRASRPLLDSLAASRAVPAPTVAQALLRLDSGVEPDLAAATRHPEEVVRAIAMEVLGLRQVVSATEDVVDSLQHDPSVEVRIRAARALGRLGMPTGLESLLAAVAPLEPIAVRTTAARALGDLAAMEAVPVLRGLLTDPEYRVAHNAAVSLVRLGGTGHTTLVEVAAGVDGDYAAAHAREALAISAIHDGEAWQPELSEVSR